MCVLMFAAGMLLTRPTSLTLVLLIALLNEATCRLNFEQLGHHQLPLRLYYQQAFNDATAVAVSGHQDNDGDNDGSARNDMLRVIMQLASYHGNQRRPTVHSLVGDVTRSTERAGLSRRKVHDVDRVLMSFPYCTGLTVPGCTALHRHLEHLANAITHNNFANSDGRMTLISVQSRRHNTFKRAKMTMVTSNEVELERKRNADEAQERYTDSDVTVDKDTATGVRQRNTEHVGVEYGRRMKGKVVTSTSSDSIKEHILRRCRQLRQQLGDGRHAARRSHRVNDQLPQQRHVADDINTDIPVPPRRNRSLVVEIEWPSNEDLSDEERDVLDAYLTWREQHGYGTLAGRWG